ncbi:hypothetical protein CW358_19770 [Pseudomonas protegens]|nr:hypothetical protein CW358_19770 [Pseudomonas protegens]
MLQGQALSSPTHAHCTTGRRLRRQPPHPELRPATRAGRVPAQRQKVSRLSAREAVIAARHQDRASEPGHLRQALQPRLGQACPLNP